MEKEKRLFDPDMKIIDKHFNKRLIDAHALADKVDESKYNNPHPLGMVRVNHRNEHDHFLRMILDAPTVDAVEVVRCKDCRHFGGHGACHCHAADENGTPIFVREDDFCSYGERKDNG